MRLNDRAETTKKSKFYVTRFKSYIYRLIFNSYLSNNTLTLKDIERKLNQTYFGEFIING